MSCFTSPVITSPLVSEELAELSEADELSSLDVAEESVVLEEGLESSFDEVVELESSVLLDELDVLEELDSFDVIEEISVVVIDELELLGLELVFFPQDATTDNTINAVKINEIIFFIKFSP